jgi:hypothetical protein
MGKGQARVASQHQCVAVRLRLERWLPGAGHGGFASPGCTSPDAYGLLHQSLLAAQWVSIPGKDQGRNEINQLECATPCVVDGEAISQCWPPVLG